LHFLPSPLSVSLYNFPSFLQSPYPIFGECGQPRAALHLVVSGIAFSCSYEMVYLLPPPGIFSDLSSSSFHQRRFPKQFLPNTIASAQLAPMPQFKLACKCIALFFFSDGRLSCFSGMGTLLVSLVVYLESQSRPELRVRKSPRCIFPQPYPFLPLKCQMWCAFPSRINETFTFPVAALRGPLPISSPYSC